MAFRVVLSGACGVHSGKVIEWSYESLLCTPPCGHRRSIGSVTGHELIAGLRAAWPKDLASVDFEAKALTVLHNGKVVPLSEPLSTSLALATTPAPSTDTSPIPSPEGLSSVRTAKQPSPSRSDGADTLASPVPSGMLLHLVFRPNPSVQPAAGNPPAAAARKPPVAGTGATAPNRTVSSRDGGCCVVS